MKIQVRERGYAPYHDDVESLEEVKGFDLLNAVHADPKVYGLQDTKDGKNLQCLVDESAEIAVVIL